MDRRRRNRLARFLLAFVAALAGLATHLVSSPDQERRPLDDAPPPLRAALLRGDFDDALAKLAELERAEPARGDLFALIRGQAQLARDDAAAAEAAFAQVESRFPQSVWLHKARFGRAQALRALRRFREAEAIVAAEAARLRSDARRGELAALAAGLADDALDPPKRGAAEAPAADPQRALQLYDQVLALDPPAPLAARVQRQRGRALELLGQHAPALEAFLAYLAAPAAATLDGDVVDARLAAARLRVALQRPAEARRDLDALATALADAKVPELAARLGDVRLAQAATWKRDDAAQRAFAIGALERFLAGSPAHAQAWNARLETAALLAADGRTQEAIDALDALLAGPPGAAADGRPRAQAEAAFRRGHLLLEQGRCDAAKASFAESIAREPAGPRWADAQSAMVEAEFRLAEVAASRKEWAAARDARAAFIAAHPLDPRVAECRYAIGALLRDEAGQMRQDAAPRTERARALEQEAIEAWRQVVRIHPGSETASRALYESGALFHDRLGDLEEAATAWRACNFGSHAGHAAARLAELLAPTLEAATQRSFRRAEPAALELRVRNHPKVAVKLHRLDLEAYFRKFLGAGAVEQLDLDLIAPDAAFDFEVPGYARWKEFLVPLPLPLEGSGTWVAVVEADEQRATTLVVKSDVDVVVKSAHRELLVFAEDRASGTAAQGVELLIDLGRREGGRRQESGTTGADGLFHLRTSEPFEPQSVRLLARRGDDVAVVQVPLEGIAAPSPLVPRGLVFTDRPAYRPGQRVEVAAFLRDVADGRLEACEGSSWTLAVRDPRGREARRETLVLDAFGSAATAFDLDAYATLGAWSLAVSRVDGPAFTGSFTVADYALDRVTLDVELARRVFFRGEPIEAEVIARWQHGAPVAGAALRVVLPDQRIEELRTDAQGRAKVRFETTDQPEERTLAFEATLLEEGISAGAQAFLALRELDLALELPARAVLADETFAVAVTALRRDGTPAECEVRLRFARRAEGGGLVDVLERRAATAAGDGRARVDAALSEGGTYVVRAETIDRFGQRIAREGTLVVSGADDPQKLRLLADRSRLEAGESTRVRLVQRCAGGLVLLTWEGHDGLRWQVLDVRTPLHEIDLATDAGLAPGFVLSAAAMRGSELHLASVAFEVTRALRLTVVPRGGDARPGSEVTVDVSAADPLGQPLAARVALAVVDDALLRQFPDRVPDPARLFALQGGAPEPWRAASSCTFRYAGTTTQISREVLAEEQRVQLAVRFAEKKKELLESLGYVEGDESADVDVLRTRAGFFLDEVADDAFEPNELLGLGGGAGGKGGGRFGRRAGGGKLASKALGAARDDAGGLDADDDTAFFAPAVTTGADGKATVTFRLPGRSTTWQLLARGITKDARAARAEARLTAREPFFAELRLPARFQQGDAPRLLATLFHDPALHSGRAELRLRARIGERTLALPASVELGEGSVEHLFEALPALPLAAQVELELTATLPGATPVEHVARAVVPVMPWGIERRVAKSGELASSTRFELALPADTSYVARALDLLIAPSAQRLLIDEALERGRARPLAPCIVPQADVAAELLGACEVLVLARQLAQADAASELDLEQLRGKVAGALARLVGTQQDDGGWPWAGAAGSERATSALAMVALARAARIGFEVPPETIANGLRYCDGALRASGTQADEAKALLLAALAGHGRADAATLQRLHRGRAGLSTAALAWCCLALAASEKPAMAAEVAATLEQRQQTGGWDAAGNRRFQRSGLETSALSVLALSAAAPGSGALARGVEFLLAARPWAPERAAGLVRAALARFWSSAVPERSEARVAVRVNGRALETVRLVPGSAAVAVAVPAELLASGRVAVELDLEGRARPSWVAQLRGFSTEVKRVDGEDLHVRSISRLAPAPLLHGKALPTGFSVLADHGARETWRNEASARAAGELLDVEVVCWLGREAADADDSDPYELEIPLPAGCELLSGSLHGSFLASAERPGRLELRLLKQGAWATVAFTLVARVPGEWRVLPPVLRSAVDPGRSAHGEPWTLRVLPRGAKSEDAYRPTPDELHARGVRLFAAGDKKGGAAALEELRAGFGGRLREPVQREVARLLLDAALESGDAARIVRSFEAVKEKDPELALAPEEVRQVAAAYRALEEHEPALELTRALIDETFSRDLKLPALLGGAQRFAESFALRERLWLEYPDTPAVKQSFLALSDELLALAPRAHEEKALRAQGLDRLALQREGMRVLLRFLTLAPADPLAPEAGLALVAAWIAIEDWENASALSEQLARRFTEPRFADSFLYSKAVAEWSLGRDDAAKGLLERIATAEYVEASGRRVPSVNRELAWYILAQIHHARRDADAAIGAYEKVADHFPDAREALHGLRERRLELPEVTLARPGEKPQLELAAKNLARAELLVYPVDLMTLCLRERNLAGVAGVNLAGIAPAARLDVELAGDARFEARAAKVALDVTQAGAYLVLARAEEHHASGLVLVSPLELAVKEDAGGQLRIHVQDAASRRYLRGVDVRVIGSRNAAFTAGESDARGLFVADGIEGRATVIARAGAREYAFWRGSSELGEARDRADARRNKDAQNAAPPAQGDYLKNVLELNRQLQGGRAQTLEQEQRKAGQKMNVQQMERDD